MRRILVLMLLVLAPVPVAARPAWACSCATGFDPLEQAETAFVGVVQEVDGDLWDARVDVRFTVESVLKGDLGDTVTLATEKDEASCGYTFVEGGRYRVYANDDRTNSCDGNELLATGVEIESADRSQIFWAGSVLVVLVVASGVTWLIRHPRAGSQ
ncbi:hypothetical protein [Actinoplanes flavus]|uniref:Tissue inhibitor of metalloproteinase n=1 Tax=Actinoplanes flavus TaxID=2820290 RepID=A0ABS3UTT9_9ACTN|nr:hypothetical protein [Actinoplanes flavus]MBO3741981.1 hypothetical protein [Actinoplanes flavus]